LLASSILKVSLRSLAFLNLIVALASSPVQAMGRHIHPGDRLQITVYNHPELSQSATVDAEHHIALPLAGTIDTANADERALAARIRGRLVGYVSQVAVEVHTTSVDQSLLVNGGPVGSLPYTPGESLASAITQLNALTHSGTAQPIDGSGSNDFFHGRNDAHALRVLREGRLLGVFDAAHLLEAGDPGPTLLPGDTIIVASKPVHVRVEGAVREPGTVYLDAEEPLESALRQAGGDTTAATSEVILSRGGRERKVALGDPIFRQPARNGDVITVPRAPRIGVVGAVEKAGEVTLPGDASILSALYNAGGPSKTADLKHVSVIHDGVKQEYNLVAAIHGGPGNPSLWDGDTVFVPVGRHPDFAAFWQALGSAGPLLYLIK
jgi:protein involved in polysaccharide export with SLBB domain